MTETPNVDMTSVTRETIEFAGEERDLIILTNMDAPEDMQRVVAGRVVEGSYQAVPLMFFGMGPKILRRIADLLERD